MTVGAWGSKYHHIHRQESESNEGGCSTPFPLQDNSQRKVVTFRVAFSILGKLYKIPHINVQRIVPMMTLNPANLTMEVHNHSGKWIFLTLISGEFKRQDLSSLLGLPILNVSLNNLTFLYLPISLKGSKLPSWGVGWRKGMRKDIWERQIKLRTIWVVVGKPNTVETSSSRIYEDDLNEITK